METIRLGLIGCGGIIKLCRRTGDPQEPFAPVEE